MPFCAQRMSKLSMRQNVLDDNETTQTVLSDLIDQKKTKTSRIQRSCTFRHSHNEERTLLPFVIQTVFVVIGRVLLAITHQQNTHGIHRLNLLPLRSLFVPLSHLAIREKRWNQITTPETRLRHTTCRVFCSVRVVLYQRLWNDRGDAEATYSPAACRMKYRPLAASVRTWTRQQE